MAKRKKKIPVPNFIIKNVIIMLCCCFYGKILGFYGCSAWALFGYSHIIDSDNAKVQGVRSRKEKQQLLSKREFLLVRLSSP